VVERYACRADTGVFDERVSVIGEIVVNLVLNSGHGHIRCDLQSMRRLRIWLRNIGGTKNSLEDGEPPELLL